MNDFVVARNALDGLHAERQAAEKRAEESARKLANAKAHQAERLEAYYLAKMTDKIPFRSATAAALDSAALENSFLQDKIEEIDAMLTRKRNLATIICHAMDDLKEEMNEDDRDDRMSVSSNISDISK